MPWIVSNAGGAGYAWSGNNTYNQHAAKVTMPEAGAITQLRVKAAGYNTGTVSTRLVLWAVGSSALAQSDTFSMEDGNESTQYTYTKDITPEVVSAGDYWVGLYRAPNESHIMETASGANGYRKTNTSTFPSVSSMSGYSSDSDDEPTVGAFYITAPSAPNSQTVTRVSNTSQTVSWNRTASTDDPYYNQYIERWDNVSNSWYAIKTLTTDYTTTGTNSYTDTSTIANRKYRYRIRAWNNAGYSSYAYTDYINTTPAAPTSVVASRSGSAVILTWTDNATNETNYKVQRKTSTDNVTWSGYSTLTSSLAADTTTYTDNSPANYNYYKVSATCTDPTLESTQVESNLVQILSAPSKPTGLSPSGIYLDALDNQTFSWNHNSTDGTAQTKYSLQYKEYGGAYPGTPQYNEISSTDEFVEIVGETFSNSTLYVWQVKTWGEHATSSDWSDESLFSCVEKPEAIITNPAIEENYGYSQLTVEWTYTQADGWSQTQYLCKLFNDSDLLLESKLASQEVLNGNDGNCVFDYQLENDTTYKVTLQVLDETESNWSVESSITFLTEFAQPMQPLATLELDSENGTITIDITNPAVEDGFEETLYNNIYRSVDDGEYELIYTEIPVNTSVTDYIPTIGGNNKYYIESVSNVPSINKSEIVELDVLLTGKYFINGCANYSEILKIIGDVGYSEEKFRHETLKQYEGRIYPVKYQGISKTNKLRFTCDLPSEYYDNYTNIIEYVGNIFYRDFHGRHFACSIQNPVLNRSGNTSFQFNCIIERVEIEVIT